jgi:hypothetical protein
MGDRPKHLTTDIAGQVRPVMWQASYRAVLKYVVAPPLIFTGKIFGVVLGPAFASLNRHFARREMEKLEQDVRTELPFLFNEHEGHIVPTADVPFPPGFDYAFLTVEVGSLRIRFSRGRGELDVAVGAKGKPHDFYDLPLVLNLMDDGEEPDRRSVDDLRHASRLLRASLSRLEGALGSHAADERLLERLKKVAVNDRIAIKEAEWEINKQLGRTH